MTIFLSNRDGVGANPSLTNEEGHYRFQTNVWSGDVLSGLLVKQSSPLNMGVIIEAGEFKIATTGYSYTGWNDADVSVTISTANPSNPRIDAIVLYVDKAANTPGTSNNPGIIKAMAVAGTPAGSPTAPTSGAIQSAVGAVNPYIKIADVRVNASVTQITNTNITDARTFLALPNSFVNTAAIADGAITAGKIDYSTMSYPFPNYSAASDITAGTYTATKNGWITVRAIVATSTFGSNATVAIGGVEVYSLQWNGATANFNVQSGAIIPIMKGQTAIFTTGLGATWSQRKFIPTA